MAIYCKFLGGATQLYHEDNQSKDPPLQVRLSKVLLALGAASPMVYLVLLVST